MYPGRMGRICSLIWIGTAGVLLSSGCDEQATGSNVELQASPIVSENNPMAGDGIGFELSTSQEADVVLVEFMDRNSVDVLISGPSRNPCQELDSGNGVDWSGQFEIGSLARGGPYHVNAFIYDAAKDRITYYYLKNPKVTDPMYWRIVVEKGQFVAETETDIPVTLVTLQVQPGRTLYQINATNDDPPATADPYLEIVPANEADLTLAYAENDDVKRFLLSARMRVALEAGETYYIRTIDRYDTGGTYFVNVVLPQPGGSGGPISATSGDVDDFEPDDSAAEATPLTLGAVGDHHSFFPLGETDWHTFTAP